MVPDPPAPTEMRSPALVGGGIAALGLGLAAVPLGFVAMVEGFSYVCTLECAPPNSRGLGVFGAVTIGLGGAGILASIPMLAVGASRVPARVTIASGPAGSQGVSFAIAF